MTEAQKMAALEVVVGGVQTVLWAVVLVLFVGWVFSWNWEGQR